MPKTGPADWRPPGAGELRGAQREADRILRVALRGAGRPVSGRAKVVNVQRKGQPYRVAFSFEDLPTAEAQRIGLEVFDAALATIPPN